ncbi:hypothetical protein F0562_022516 [Nyssa sinensis]|uniref:Serine-threonine/tyrosine-protein kinase catalytic domain-containing protein n=1 Tax=Nyssa sinensis TaxID=561372 RepID=A0A5J5BP89_9ASTE|nr:hypothetical protein F0562_022516 [Nyssa sinensis]
MFSNSLSGNLPATTGFRLPNLQGLYLAANWLGGNIPVYLSNSSMLTVISLGYNLFTGSIPTSLGNLQLLRVLTLPNNQLTTENGNLGLSFLTALTRCRSLERLVFENNPIDGVLPSSIGNFSSSLQTFVASGCQIKGPIPREIGTLKNLNFFQLSNNSVNGSIPSAIGGLESLQRLYLDGNVLEGLIPDEICNLAQLGELSLQSNRLFGPIPTCIGNLGLLQKLFLGSNSLNSSIPDSLWTLENLFLLNLSINSFDGYLPSQMKMSNVMESMDLSWNHIEGKIPQKYGSQGRVSTKCDIYSYGIMLLETITRKKPTDEMFAGELSLRQWVKASLPNKVMEFVDGDLLATKDGKNVIDMQGFLTAIMELGVECSAELPEERSDIKDVVVKLNKIKLQLLCSSQA